MIRLPDGLPDARAAEAYFEKDALSFLKDTTGPGGILCLQPFYEAGDLEEIWEVNELLDRLLPLRAEILNGDPRPLYLAHLAVAKDGNHDPNKEKDAPVPAGLDKLTKAQLALAELYELSEDLLAAAAMNGPPLPARMDAENLYEAWLKRQPAATKNAWLCQLLADPDAGVRREILAKFQKSQSIPAWPTVRVDRTIAELDAAAEVIASQKTRKKTEQAARSGLRDWRKWPTIPSKRSRRRRNSSRSAPARLTARSQRCWPSSARHSPAAVNPNCPSSTHKLKEKNPTLKGLTGALRKQGFLMK